MSTETEEFQSSRLGTKEHWDETFERELSVYADTKDAGEVWFGEESVERVADWMDEASEVTKSSAVLDIGCGNGMMLIELAKRGYSRLTGTDYSSNAIQLARLVAADSKLRIQYEVGDILDSAPASGSVLHESCQYDVCLDKGTYDAISLNPDKAGEQRERYAASLQQLVRPHGLFIITSCNWTQDELVEHFKHGFALLKKIPTPTFQFGGITGSRETVLVLQRL